MASMKAFQYEPLDPNLEKLMLRRLELLPGTGQIQCKLESVSLNDKPVYEAISYHWGSTAEKYQIVCNSASLTITDSLHSALVRFRRPEESRHLWADQLCINQADSDERGRQVGFMREIYENAIQTLVWLGGKGDDDPNAVFDLLRRLATAQRRRRACTPPDKRTIYELSSAEAAEYNLPEATSKIWKAFQILFLRPWFAHLWVIQEVNVSKSVAIYCHNSEISAADFMAGVECANELGPLWLFGKNMSLKNPFRVLMNQSQDVKRPSLISLLLGFSYFQATDPRDKVYALLGLAPAHERANIIPNYNLTTKQVFHSTTTAILEQSGNLDILCAVTKQHTLAETEVSGLPSWVCDYVNMSPHCLLPQHDSIRKWRNIKDPEFCADKNSASQPNFSADRQELILCGFVLDSIDAVGPPDIRAENRDKSALSKLKVVQDAAYLLRVLTSWKSLAQTVGQNYRSGEDVNDVFWQLLMGGCAPEDYKMAQTEYQQWFVLTHYSLRILRLCHLLRFRSVCLVSICFIIGRVMILDKLKICRPLDISFNNRIGSIEHNRCIRTTNGWLGLAPAACRVGDVAALFRGGRVPLVLRASGAGKWKLVGAAYVHGVMYGEAFEEDKCEICTLSNQSDDLVCFPMMRLPYFAF
jgi:hypothetical protein